MGQISNAVAKRDEAVGAFDPQDQKVLQHLGLNPADPKARALVAVAQHYGLDPLLGHIIVIPGKGPYITRDGYLHVAHDSGQLDGIVVEQEPTLVDDGKFWFARVTVHRKDMRYGFTYPGRYSTNGKNKEFAPEMALKAAESHALRRAFSVTGLGSAEERFVDEAEPAEVAEEPPHEPITDGRPNVDEVRTAAGSAAESQPEDWPEAAKPGG